MSAETAGEAESDESLLELRIEAAGWGDALRRDEPALTAWAEAAVLAALAAAGAPAERLSVSLLLADDAEIATLNARFRGQEKPTNVLSWPAFPLAAPWPDAEGIDAPSLLLEERRSPLGDVALALETCAREAEAARLPLDAHAAHLIVHGVLHLLGYDHGTDEEAEAMAAREIAALDRLGVADPYAEREGAS